MRLIAIFILLFSAHSLSAATWKTTGPNKSEVVVTLSSDEISLQDQLSVDLVLTYPKTWKVDTEILKAHLLKGWNEQMVFYPVSEKIENLPNGMHLSYILEPLAVGTFPVSFLDIPFTSTDQKEPIKILTKIFDVTIKPVPQVEEDSFSISSLLPPTNEPPLGITEINRKRFLDSPQINEIEAKRNVELFKERTFPLIPLLLLSGFIVLAYLLRNRLLEIIQTWRKGKIVPPKTKALEQLNELSKTRTDNEKENYTEVSTIMKQFLTDFYGLQTSSQTTEELIQTIMGSARFDTIAKEKYRRFLNDTDSIKFTKRQPSSQDLEAAIEAAKDLICQ